MKGFNIVVQRRAKNDRRFLHVDMTDDATEADAVLVVNSMEPKATVITVNGHRYETKNEELRTKNS